MNKKGRWITALPILLMIPATWWATRVTDWVPEIFGIYTVNRFLFNLLATALLLAAFYLLTSRKNTRQKILSVMATFLVAGICVLLLELPAIILGFDYQKVFKTLGPDNALHLSEGVNKADPVLIHIHWPNSAFSGEVVGNLAQLGIPDPARYHVDVRYDHKGFRNDRDYEQADIAVIGDSFVEAAIVPFDQTFVEHIEKQTGVPTVNLGQIAYGLKQELEVLKRFALPLSPKVVVWALFGGNDLRDIDGYESMVEHFGEPREPAPLGKRTFFRNFLVAVSGTLTNRFRRQPSENALNHSGLFQRADGVSERVYFGQTNKPVTASEWDVTVETLTEANRLSKQAGARFIVVYIPRKFRVYREYLELQVDTEIAGWRVNDLPDRMDKWCKENDIAYIDTTPILKESAAEGISPYFIDDVHWNTLGHRLAGAGIVGYLKRNRIHPFEVTD
jgi:hypothetical protein